MRVWIAAPESASGGFWRQTMRSTKLPYKTTSKRAAKRFADEMEGIGRELRTVKPDMQWYTSRVDSLLRLASVATPSKKTTWAKAAEEFIRSSNAKQSTIKKYTTDTAHFTRWLGVRASHDLRDITADDIRAFLKHMRDQGFSEGTSIVAGKIVRSVLSRAVKLRSIDSNPADLITFERTQDTTKRKGFSQDEIRKIFACIKDDKEWTRACLFGLYFGMRLGDACNRHYEEIKDGVLHFIPEKKSRRGRVVSVPLIGELSSIAGKGPITPKLQKLTVSVASGQFSRILDKAGIVRSRHKATGKGRDVVDKTFHSWRHTINAMLLDAGVDQRIRQLISDHDSIKISNRYTAASIDTMAKALSKAIKLPS